MAGRSGSGGKVDAADSVDGSGSGQEVNTPRPKIAMVTDSGEGDTFWDIVQSGARQTARKDV